MQTAQTTRRPAQLAPRREGDRKALLAALVAIAIRQARQQGQERAA